MTRSVKLWSMMTFELLALARAEGRMDAEYAFVNATARGNKGDVSAADWWKHAGIRAMLSMC